MKKNILWVGSLLLLWQPLIAQEKILMQEYPLTAMQKQNRSIVAMASESLNKSLPQKIDTYTTLTKIEGKEETLLYTFEIDTGAKSDEAVQKEDRTRMEKAITHGICLSSKRFLKADIHIAYRYLSAKSKKELFRFDIQKADCDYLD